MCLRRAAAGDWRDPHTDLSQPDDRQHRCPLGAGRAAAAGGGRAGVCDFGYFELSSCYRCPLVCIGASALGVRLPADLRRLFELDRTLVETLRSCLAAYLFPDHSPSYFIHFYFIPLVLILQCGLDIHSARIAPTSSGVSPCGHFVCSLYKVDPVVKTPIQGVLRCDASSRWSNDAGRSIESSKYTAAGVR